MRDTGDRSDASAIPRVPTSNRTGICVGIATRSRPEQLAAVVDHIGRQKLRPDTIIVSCTSPEDIGPIVFRPGIEVVYGSPGLARQRNAVLRSLPADAQIVVFFDDDFFAHPDWLAVVAQTFENDPTVACITGHVVADGILGPGLTIGEAMRRLSECSPAAHGWVVEDYSPYGCNMAYRRSALADLWFDERLVLYGWLEDRDFGSRVARTRGRLIKLGSALGVHLGVKKGRVSGLKLGYSQVMNPAYMRWKTTMTSSEALRQVARNVAANSLKSLRPEPHIDRRGRLTGNLIAVADLLRRRITPERAESL